MVGELGRSPLDKDFTVIYFKKILHGRKGRVNSFLLNQKRVADIDNVSVQDILFLPKLHPDRKLNTLTIQEVESLFTSIRTILLKSVEKGSLAYERVFCGDLSRFSEDDFIIAYQTGKPCPKCSIPIKKIKSGPTASYVCPV